MSAPFKPVVDFLPYHGAPGSATSPGFKIGMFSRQTGRPSRPAANAPTIAFRGGSKVAVPDG